MRPDEDARDERSRTVTVPELSLAEERVIVLVARGRTAAGIAAELGLEERTVAWHLARARRKLARIAELQRRVEDAMVNDRRQPPD